eukprot:TRINITY_DN66782_c6_g1_i1.p1 TRINITY_DN66782_c6_g1~~TRINITY_DN66782_c6_g1_i1.p1  ORF type:complete len:632 (-),score=132.10 TRINITY_DN66782_c6_g1_i1:981-2729(-)
MTIVIALKTDDTVLEAKAHSVSNPQSSEYGEHLTTKQIADLVKPSNQAVSAVTAWLDGISFEVGATGDMFHLNTDVATVERLFQTRIHHVHNHLTKQNALRAEDTTIPTSVAGHIAAVFGLYGLPLPSSSLGPIEMKAGAGMPAKVTPDVIEKVYNVSGVTPSGSLKNIQAVSEFQAQYMTQSDLTTFFSKYVPGKPTADHEVYKYVGPHAKQPGSSLEAALDIQYIMGVTPGLKSEFWLWPAMSFCLDLVKWTQAILKDEQAPNVFSVSYGWQGNLTEVGCEGNDVQVVDAEFKKLAAKGISIIFASGDSGSGYTTGCRLQTNTEYVGDTVKTIHNAELFQCCGNCTTAAGCGAWNYDGATHECTLKKKSLARFRNGFDAGPPTESRLWPSWPASSPWVTAVGSTRFIDQTPGKGEQATDQFGSGSGFSTMFKAPTWQQSAIGQYFKEEPKSKLPPQGLWPRNGRATPDVAALGEGFQVVVNGHVTTVGGTSAATPTFAATISLINEARIKAGKKPLGYLNHWIYQEGNKIFRDVTVGSDRYGRGPFPLPYGFDCQKGWDPVTGWGTPDFPKMLASAMKNQ